VVLPLASVTVQITVVFPAGNVEGALFVTDITEQCHLIMVVLRKM